MIVKDAEGRSPRAIDPRLASIARTAARGAGGHREDDDERRDDG